MPLGRIPAGRLEVPEALPRGPHALPRDVVFVSQRRRLLDAMVAVVAEKGYLATTVADVIKRARVSRTTFYEQFSDKEACFLAAYQEGGDLHYQAVLAATQGVEDPLDQIRAGVCAYLRTLAAEPEFARAFLVEILAAGPAALELRQRLQQRYVALLMRFPEVLRASGHPAAPVPAEVILAATAGIDQLILHALREQAPPEQLPELEATAIYVLLALLGLPGAAELSRIPHS